MLVDFCVCCQYIHRGKSEGNIFTAQRAGLSEFSHLVFSLYFGIICYAHRGVGQAKQITAKQITNTQNKGKNKTHRQKNSPGKQIHLNAECQRVKKN